MKIVLRRPDSLILRKLWGYSFYVFLIHMSVQIAYYSDNLIVGAFLSPAAVTVYAIGGMLDFLRPHDHHLDDRDLQSPRQQL